MTQAERSERFSIKIRYAIEGKPAKYAALSSSRFADPCHWWGPIANAEMSAQVKRQLSVDNWEKSDPEGWQVVRGRLNRLSRRYGGELVFGLTPEEAEITAREHRERCENAGGKVCGTVVVLR
jgi:hypothetical protein